MPAAGTFSRSHRDDGDGAGLELLALDRGSGMTDVGRCMDDGYSTAGSPGNGLGAIARLADDLRIYSRPGLGTAIMVRFLQKRRSDTHRTSAWRRGRAISRRAGLRRSVGISRNRAGPHPGGGRRCRPWRRGGARSGHRGAGVPGERRRFLRGRWSTGCIGALMPTRGAAVAIARIDEAARTVRFAGVGNICGVLVTAAGSPAHGVA